MDKLFIPKKLNVGFQKRNDTYTGNLGYVIYWDNKNVLRKEGSWAGWRDKTIDNLVCDNEPIEGFVLNKEVGGVRHSWSWNARREKVRVYDPRNFEFEITIENMLYILSECTSSKGKGLEGKFVYAWAGPELVLLPVGTLEYKQCTNFTDLQSMKISKNEMVVGCSYTFKDTNTFIYLGKLDYYTNEGITIPNPHYDPNKGWSYNRWNSDNIDYRSKDLYQHTIKSAKALHIFYSLDKNGNATYRTESGFTKIATKDTQIPVSNLAELVVEYQSTKFGGKCVGLDIIDTELDFSTDNIYDYNYNDYISLNDKYFIIKDNKVSQFLVSEYFKKEWDNVTNKYIRKELYGYLPLNCQSVYNYWLNDNNILCFNHKRETNYIYSSNYKDVKWLTKDQLLQYKFKKVKVILENGTKLNIEEYIK